MGRKPWVKALRLISRNALAYGLATYDRRPTYDLSPNYWLGTKRIVVDARGLWYGPELNAPVLCSFPGVHP